MRGCGPPAAALVTSRSIDERKAASVLPLPVGAQMSVCSPGDDGRPAPILGCVGSGNDAPNQARTAGENAARTG